MSSVENEIVGEALIALKHEELKEMGIASVGHRLTILKHVYEEKVSQGIPIDPDHYVPLCEPQPDSPNRKTRSKLTNTSVAAEQNPQFEMATKDDIQRLTRSMIKLRDDRIAQAEA